MQAYCDEKEIALRPHAKTHKSAAIAKRQIAGGAVGICCATLAEAELLSAQGIEDILITSPVVHASRIERLVQIHRQTASLACVVDNHDVVLELEKHLAVEHPLRILVDLDPGMHRTGIRIGANAIRLVEAIESSDVLDLGGVQCYAGSYMHIQRLAERTALTRTLWTTVRDLVETLARQGVKLKTVSGGGTGTYDLDWRSSVLTELQAGSYPFMDCEYFDNEWETGEQAPFEPSLFVLTSVVSNNVPGRATVDAGLKALATDSVVPRIAASELEVNQYRFMGDEHGALLFSDSNVKAELGAQVLLYPPHCDPTINLYDSMYVVDEDLNVVDQIEITARSGSVLNT